MGFLKRKIKPNKDYSLKEALALLKQPQYEDYTTIYVGKGRYHIILVEKSRELEKEINRKESSQKAFLERLQVKGKMMDGKSAEIIHFNEYRQNKYAEEREVG